MGAVDGNQHTADLLMKAGEAVFVYPVRLPHDWLYSACIL